MNTTKAQAISGAENDGMDAVPFHDDDELNRQFTRQRLFTAFSIAAPVIHVIRQHESAMGSVLDSDRDALQAALYSIRVKYSGFWHGPFFRIHQTRVKGTESVLKKLFNTSMYASAGDNDQADALLDVGPLGEAYDSIIDLVGGRLCVAFSDDMDRAVQIAKEELQLRGVGLAADIPDKDYRREPMNGYRAHHFFVRYGTSRAADGALLVGAGRTVAEVQVRTLLQHAWSEMCHDLVYKTLQSSPACLPIDIERDSVVLGDSLDASDRFFSGLRGRVKQWLLRLSGR